MFLRVRIVPLIIIETLLVARCTSNYCPYSKDEWKYVPCVAIDISNFRNAIMASYLYLVPRTVWADTGKLVCHIASSPAIADEEKISAHMPSVTTELSLLEALRFLCRNGHSDHLDRRAVVERLARTADDELITYIVQLMQALWYENLVNNNADRSCTDSKSVEMHQCRQGRESVLEGSLAKLLISRSTKSVKFGLHFWWHLRTGVAQQNSSKNFTVVEQHFLLTLNSSNDPQCQEVRRAVEQQTDFVRQLTGISDRLAAEEGDRLPKQKLLRQILASPESKLNKLVQEAEIRLPLDPEIVVKGIQADSALLFKSHIIPIRLDFVVSQGANRSETFNYPLIFKPNADLRTDQFVSQLVGIMDNILRHDNLDLCLLTYKVLPVSTTHGFIQFVPNATPLIEILEEHGSVQKFLRTHAPNATAPFGIRREVMDCYVKSCAGYSLITYMLGVGDRHNDNLLVVPNTGQLFHIDMEHILDRIAVGMILRPRPMHFTKDMVDAMGDLYEKEFKRTLYAAFLCLRRHVSIILNLFELMLDSNIADIVVDPSSVLEIVKDKFGLDLTDEQAIQHIQSKVDESINSVHGELGEKLYSVIRKQRI